MNLVTSSTQAARTIRHSRSVLAGAASLFLLGSFAVADTPNPILPPPATFTSTVPSNGDVNPYGVAFVPKSVPSDAIIKPGDILVSNFNNKDNLQGTGTTIVKFSNRGVQSLFFQGNVKGLTAALGVLRNGFVFVGSLPTADGTPATAQPGSLLVINPKGQLVGQLVNKDLFNGPWGMAIFEQEHGALVFVSNVLTGTITRFVVLYTENGIEVGDFDVIGSGFNHRPDPAALELGPSGLAFDPNHNVLFVANSADNVVYAIRNAATTESSQGTGTVIYNDPVHLHGPLDLAIAPNGDLLVANSDGSNADPNQPSEIVEFTADGTFVTQFSVDPNNGGAFGVAVKLVDGFVRLAAVDDNAVTLGIWNFPLQTY